MTGIIQGVGNGENTALGGDRDRCSLPLALFLWAVGTFGWFGQEPDPLSAVFLIPIGLPWNRFGEGLAIALLAPLANVAILEGLSRLLARRAV